MDGQDLMIACCCESKDQASEMECSPRRKVRCPSYELIRMPLTFSSYGCSALSLLLLLLFLGINGVGKKMRALGPVPPLYQSWKMVEL